MILTATVTVTADVTTLQRCFCAEIAAMQTKRSNVIIETTKDALVFNVKAHDPTALRATLHNITKLLTVFEKGINDGKRSRKTATTAKH